MLRAIFKTIIPLASMNDGMSKTLFIHMNHVITRERPQLPHESIIFAILERLGIPPPTDSTYDIAIL